VTGVQTCALPIYFYLEQENSEHCSVEVSTPASYFGGQWFAS
jgi:hypothetical protein